VSNMYSPKLKSSVAQFLAMHTGNMKQVRDHIPAGPEFFWFYFNDTELNWYEFWDHIAEVRPCGCKLVTNMFTIVFDEHSLRWKCISQEDSAATSATVTLICDALNDNFIRSSTISGWNRHTINS
jgi:hypothetical protein